MIIIEGSLGRDISFSKILIRNLFSKRGYFPTSALQILEILSIHLSISRRHVKRWGRKSGGRRKYSRKAKCCVLVRVHYLAQHTNFRRRNIAKIMQKFTFHDIEDRLSEWATDDAANGTKVLKFHLNVENIPRVAFFFFANSQTLELKWNTSTSCTTALFKSSLPKWCVHWTFWPVCTVFRQTFQNFRGKPVSGSAATIENLVKVFSFVSFEQNIF